MIKLMKGDCLERMKEIESGSVDLILTDLPYGTMKGAQLDGWEGKKTDWDAVIDCDKIHAEANRILRKNGKMVLFAQQPFTTELITKANANLPLNYSMTWEKDHFANALVAKKAPVSYAEDILVSSKREDTDWCNPLRGYATKILDFIPLEKKEILRRLEKGDIRFFRTKQDEFGKPSSVVYRKLINLFYIDNMAGFKTYDEIKSINNKYKNDFASTFNLWEGNKYKSNILKYKKDYDGHHPTQKPVLLLEDLIKTFSNEGDLVVDMTMGSGSTGVACVNTNRNFIGSELDENYFNIAKQRIENT